MKKLTIIALALCLAVVMAAPVMAVDADFSGEYRVRGSYVEHYDLKSTSPSHDFMDMRFRLQTVFKASDNLSVTTRFDALDNNMLGSTLTNDGTAASDISFDRAYMTIKTDFGKFDLGRMSGGAWGTSFIDNETEKDRIKFTKTMDNMTLYLVYQKNEENDYTTTSTLASDEDSETYYLLTKYKLEDTTAGLLLAFTNNKATETATTRKYSAAPYFVSKFGPLTIQGELQYNWGDTDNDGTVVDVDIKELAYNVEASYNFGPGSVMAGYAFVSGDNDDATEDSAFGHVGDDWEKLFILTTSEITDLDTNLGSIGNLSEDQNEGSKIIYGGANFSPLDNLNIGFVVGHAEADKVQTGKTKDEYGTEYDLTLNWQIYDNLTYTAIAAYLDAGDLYEEYAGAANFDDTYALFHQLQLSF